MDKTQCFECNKSDDEVRLHKCPMCFKYFCEEHGRRMSGVLFCSRGCAEYFFFSEADE